MSDFYSGKRVLITGGLGFIGSNLARALVGHGARVTLVDSMIPSYGASLENISGISEKVAINFSDIRDGHSLRYLVKNQDVVFSLAGQVSHLDSMTDPMTDLDINCRSQLSLLECCRCENRNVRIVFASTRQIYGRPQSLPVTEDHPLLPADVNGINKLAAEMYFTLYAQVHGMNTFSLRLTNTYGPRMDLRNMQKGFVGVFLSLALQGKPIQIYGTGQQRRDFNHVADAVSALLLAGERSDLRGCSMNLGHPDHHSLLDFIEILRSHVDFEYSLIPFPEDRKSIDIGDYYGSFDRFHSATGWKPKFSLADGMADTVEYFRTHPEQL